MSGLQSVVQGIRATCGRARQFWRVFETSRVPMTMADNERNHLAANAPARLLFRLTLADVLERRIDDLTPPENMPLLYERWARLMNAGSVAGHYDICLPDGSELTIVYSAVANALPGQHLIVFAPAEWPDDELVDQADEANPAPPRVLSPREREVLRLIAAGADRQEIADELTISVATVRTHVRNILRKLNARNRAHAIALAMQHGLLEVPLAQLDQPSD
ncbi:MAG: LuxR C-terminal-related transcriptional regulator [Candidatus Woesearchaeota archaeon]